LQLLVSYRHKLPLQTTCSEQMQVTDVLLLVFGLAFGAFFVWVGKQALLSQSTFLRLCNRWYKTKEFGLEPFDIGYFGGTKRLRLMGIGLIALGLFIMVWFAGLLFSHLP
jgi:hypothetical protein